jgi:hypothetical protein
MSSGQPLYLCERILHPLSVKTPYSLEEGVFVAEVAMLGAAACDHHGIRNPVAGTPDEIAANRRNPLQRAARC